MNNRHAPPGIWSSAEPAEAEAGIPGHLPLGGCPTHCPPTRTPGPSLLSPVVCLSARAPAEAALQSKTYKGSSLKHARMHKTLSEKERLHL